MLDWEELGKLVDTIDNLITARTMPIDPRIHLQALDEALPEIRDKIKRFYIAGTGENPWEK